MTLRVSEPSHASAQLPVAGAVETGGRYRGMEIGVHALQVGVGMMVGAGGATLACAGAGFCAAADAAGKAITRGGLVPGIIAAWSHR